ncbi:MAG: hypothetical protein NDJ90_01440 [Oligoflexia bacterium]|nr:hypothetical protein [Oligoflexia bacterium]
MRTRVWVLVSVLVAGALGGSRVGAETPVTPCRSDVLNGIFCELPIPAAEELPSPRESCSPQAWNSGLREALGGQHYLLGYVLKGQAQLRFSQSSSSVPTAKLKACSDYRGTEGGEAAAEKLQCCIDAFYKGLELQALRIEQELKRKEGETSADLARCVNSYMSGQSDGRKRCEFENSAPASGARRSCPKLDFTSVSYLGCYQIGFLRTVVSCDCPTARASIPVLKAKAPAIFSVQDLMKPAGSPSEPLMSSEPEARDAGKGM